MSKVTICVPARNELYLEKCIDDIFEKATGDIEVILVLDNCWPDPIIKDRDNLTIIHWGGRRGMRTAINAGAEIGKGEFLMKVDAHCSFDEGFDEKLKASCDIDWVVTPTRYSLDSDTWTRRTDKPPVEHEYLSYPHENGEDVGLHAKYWWKERDRASKEDISENMAFQGSCWIMHMKYFKSLLYPMDEVNYGMFVAEPQEIGLKVWLSGGKQMLNKSTWYAHLWKGQGYRDLHTQKFGFPYTRVGRKELERGNKFSMDFWFNNRWVDRKHDLSYLVERFWPVPTWPEDRGLWGGK